MEEVGIFTVILSILRPNGIFVWPFGTSCCHLAYFTRFGMLQ
jgi:hypothetical protein